MKVEAVYNNGQLILPKTLSLCKEVFRVSVEIEDELVINQETDHKEVDVSPSHFSIRKQLDAILGCKRDGNITNSVTAQEYKHMWHNHLEEKYLECR
ncbi:MAG: hypothetical protein HQK69_02050 [Desulfamplus sp.]|nr:hypothetical protein [Desulfamplus sp.]